MHYAFQTPAKLHLVLDYVSGGELFTHLYQREKFKESEVRIYIAEIVLALQHLHKVRQKYYDNWHLSLEKIFSLNFFSEWHHLPGHQTGKHPPRWWRSYRPHRLWPLKVNIRAKNKKWCSLNWCITQNGAIFLNCWKSQIWLTESSIISPDYPPKTITLEQ